MFKEKNYTNWSFWRGALLGGVFVALTLTAFGWLIKGVTSPASTVNVPQDIITAYNLGRKDALKTDPPSMMLELTCAKLEVNEASAR